MILTLIELHIGLLPIRPREFTSLKWTKKSMKLPHPDIGGCHHLNRYIQHSNNMILWIAREVLVCGMNLNSLKSSLEFFIMVADDVMKLNNFNTLFAIMEALRLPAIKRLTSSWDLISNSLRLKYESLVRVCESSNNYEHYRNHIHHLGDQTRIPCLSVLLRDITLLESSHSWKVEHTAEHDMRLQPDQNGVRNGYSDNGVDHVKKTVVHHRNSKLSSSDINIESLSGNLKGDVMINMSKMKAIFDLLCREVFSLRSPIMSSYYASKILCRIHIRDLQELLNGGNDDGNIGSRGVRRRRSISSDDEHCDNVDDYYILISASLNNSTLEEEFFDDCTTQTSSKSDEFVNSITIPTSSLLSCTSSLSTPLMSLKLKKQLQSIDKEIDMKIHQQMTTDILKNLLFCDHKGKKCKNSNDQDRRVSQSPMKKKKDMFEYDEPLAVIPHSMSICDQDVVQSFIQCLDEGLFSSSAKFCRAHKKQRESKKKSSFFSIFSSSDDNDVAAADSNMKESMILVGYDKKVISIYKDIMR